MPLTFTTPRVSRLTFCLWLAFMAAIVAIDQATKVYFQATLTLGESVPVWRWFNWTLAFNEGAAFSFLAQQGGWQRWLFCGIGVVVVMIAIVVIRKMAYRRLFTLSVALLAAGALGNLIDRALLGYVVDFIDWHIGDYHWPAFNVADIAICLGAAGLLLTEVFEHGRR